MEGVPFGHMSYKFEIIGRGTGADDFLSVVLGRNKRDLTREPKFVVWYYNHQEGGFGNGHYTNDHKSATKEFWRRADSIRHEECDEV